MNPTKTLYAAAHATQAQEAIEHATYLRALDDLAARAEAAYRAAQSAHHYMETEHWRQVRRWIADQRREAAGKLKQGVTR